MATDIDEVATETGRVVFHPADVEARQRRVPFSGAEGQRKLFVDGDKDPSLEYRWFAMEGDRVRRAIRGGWNPVVKGENYQLEVSNGDMADDTDWITKETGRTDTGNPQISVYMAIKKDFYDEDQRAKAGVVDSREDAIRRDEHSSVDDPSMVYGSKDNRMETNFRR